MQNPSLILIVDDDLHSREGIEALLEAEGYRLELAENGVECLERATVLQPDVILLDVMMPGMDGYEVCRRLRANPLLAEVPILMITALDDPVSRLQGIEAGVDDFISKPFNIPELRARVRTITRLNRYRSLQVEHTRSTWILEQAQDGYVILDKDDKLLYANAQGRLYLGLPEGESAAMGAFLDIARWQYHPQPDEAWQNWPEPAVMPRFLVRPENPTAQVMWLKLDQLVSRDELTFGRLVQLRDVTEQVTTRRDMRKFHTIVEHKLRTPLAHLQMSLELLRQQIDKHHFDEIENLALNASKGVQRLGIELNDTLEYIAAPALAGSGQGFDLIWFQARVETISADLGLEKVHVLVPAELLKERLVLTQYAIDLILREILENAMKFHPQHMPEVDVVLSPVNTSIIRLCIQDDGVTLSPMQLAWVWVPYVQGEKYFTGEIPGMGLGLPLVSALVWQVGGSVRLVNRMDSTGVRVELDLPLVDQKRR